MLTSVLYRHWVDDGWLGARVPEFEFSVVVTWQSVESGE
jgi:hypothetical protein